MLDKSTIIEFIRKNKDYLRKHFHIKKIALFGSFANGSQTETSDVDILIELEENTPNIFELKQELREFFKKHLGRNVDIAREKYLKSDFKEMIIKEAIYV